MSSDASRRPIGVFDSGLGGLTVVREIQQQLGHEDVIYFGDIARLPYGIKSKQQITQYSIQNTIFLLNQNIKALVVACNSSASASLSVLKRIFHLPIIDVIEPAAQAAVQRTKNGRIGIIGTRATIQSKAYDRRIKQLNPSVQVFTQSAPLLVPLVEEGWMKNGVCSSVLESYLENILKKKIDTLILGCTHYPLLENKIREVVGRKVQIINCAPPTVAALKETLQDRYWMSPKRSAGQLKMFVSDLPPTFLNIGERFLGRKIANIKVVRV
jgi:glutamate racemase